ncbi:MAG: asparagine synthase (glutamine-hydrolyzing) [Deltaproteobacteria bacterium]|nr:asparagine synthase (glutamine-hydrolyzing) [Deltaproteobacteria bacterium]
MCGIAGLFHYRSDAVVARGPIQSARVARMCQTLAHRGPDDEGTYHEAHMALTMRRLAIIDPQGGQQPIASEDGDVVAVCNGEIYNFRELRAELQARGHRFRGQSDTEVLVHLYEEEGDALVSRLRGMFGLAIWDRRRQQLLLARDRLGIKPLYIADHQGTLVFGSELKAVLASELIPRRVDRTTLHHFLSLNYVPAPYSMVEGVEQLEPGTLLVCNASGARIHRYWDLPFGEEEDSEASWTRRIREKLMETVATHLVSDVPFGAFLSGGLDSSAVVALMAGCMREKPKTFAMDFAEESFSEARFAQEVATRFGCEHREFVAKPTIVHHLSELIWHADDPLADSSMLPVFLLAREAKKHVSMVLTGDGGDEVFAGYPTYRAYFVRQLYRRVPALLRRQIVRRMVNALPVSRSKVSFDYKAKRFVSGAELDAEEAHFWWRAIFSEHEKHTLYSEATREALGLATPTSEIFRRHFALSGSDDPLSRMLYVDTRLYLPADMLVKVDRMTMASGLEARVPFLDHELVELVARVPSAIKFRRHKEKALLKRAVRDLLPKSILQRKKAGFNVPVNAWLGGELRPLAERTLSPERVEAAGFFRPEAVAQLFAEHNERKHDHSYRLWGLLCFQLWYERFIVS